MSWLIVRMSREQKVLVKVRGFVKDRFRVGRITDGFLVFRDGKSKKRIGVEKGCTYKAVGVICIDVDDEKNAVCMPNYSVVGGYDAEKNENLHVRALTAPHLDDHQLRIILLLVVFTLAGVALTLYLVYGLSTQIEGLKTLAQTVPK